MVRVFNHFFQVSTLVRVLLDTCLLIIAAALAIAWRAPEWFTLHGIGVTAVVFAVIVTLAMSLVGMYDTDPYTGQLLGIVGRTLFAFLIVLPISYGLAMLMPQSERAMGVVNAGTALGLGGMLVMRAASYARNGEASLFARRVLIMGASQQAVSVVQSLHECGPGFQVVGCLPAASEDEVSIQPSMLLSRSVSLREWVERLNVSEVVVAVRERRGGALPLRELLDCKLSGVQVTDQVSFLERVRGQVHLDSLRASWLIYGDGFRRGTTRNIVKRLFDLSASLVLLVLTAPLMALAALVVSMESHGPIIYRQERVGQGGRTFNVLKFRSMCNNAEADGKPRWAGQNDSRVTRFGKFMRKTRIDELPQLFNVIRGDMSFVGPRPERPFFVDQLTRDIPFYAGRHSVKPGITGWAQVKYAYGASVDDAVAKLQYDLYYVKNHTVFLDLMILFQTIRVVLTGQGAR